MEAPQPETDPPPERRFEPRRRENAEEIIHWLRVLGGRFQAEPSTARAGEAVRGTTAPRTRRRRSPP